MRKRSVKMRGFTLVELVVSLAIFAFMTAFLLAKYGSFNQNVLLTNLAYDTALTVRNAQSYGLNVQGTDAVSCAAGYSAGSTCFYYAYGVDFDMTNPTHFTFFIDSDSSNTFNSGDTTLNTYNMNKGYAISSICAGNDAATCTSLGSTGKLDITFKRPVPDAIIVVNGNAAAPVTYAKIVVTANGQTASVIVQSTGEISVGN